MPRRASSGPGAPMPIAPTADLFTTAASIAARTVPTRPVARPRAPAVGSVVRLADPSAFAPRYTVASIFEPPRSMPTTSASMGTSYTRRPVSPAGRVAILR